MDCLQLHFVLIQVLLNVKIQPTLNRLESDLSMSDSDVHDDEKDRRYFYPLLQLFGDDTHSTGTDKDIESANSL